MTLLTIPVDTRSGKLDIPINSPIVSSRISDVDEIEVIDYITKEVLLHLFLEPCDAIGLPCKYCDLNAREYLSLCQTVFCVGYVWKDTRKAMEDL